MTEFLVRIEIRYPDGLDPQVRDELSAREAARGQALQEAGSIVRIWWVPGRRANVAIWQAADADELHDLLASLPLFPFLDITVEPLASHPLERT